jgi:hypothetical protein
MSSHHPETRPNSEPLFLSGDEIREKLHLWIKAWNHHDLEGVIMWFHDEIEFIHWDGSIIRGKAMLKNAWRGWFTDHGDFKFEIKDILIDPEAQKVFFSWRLQWPSRESGFTGKKEIREGGDVMHFRERKIISKQTFTKTSLLIDGKRTLLKAVQ